MMQLRKRIPRDPQRGSVTILVAALWMALFGMAALAVDAGHMYLTKRNLQEAADAAVMAGLPSLTANAATAQTNARNMAIQSGYATGNITTSTGTSGGFSTLTVTISATETFFFAKALRFTSKTFSATSVGQASGAAPAIFAASTTCSGTPSPVGIQLNGGPTTITGSIESNGLLNCYGTCTESGSSVYGGGAGCFSNIAGATNSGGSLAFPYSYTTSSFGSCTFGSLGALLSIGTAGATWWATGGPSGGTLKPGVYCGSQIDLSANTVSGTVTLVSTGQINISSSTANLSAFSTVNGTSVLAFTTKTSDCYSNQAINVGNSAVTLTGALIAPNGCVNTSGTNITINGSLAGNEVQIGSSGTTLDSSGGGAAGYWIYQ